MQNYHLTKAGDEWQLKAEGAERASKTFATKEEAVSGAAEFLSGKTASLKIHGEDGKIQEERTYPRSADPAKYEG